MAKVVVILVVAVVALAASSADAVTRSSAVTKLCNGHTYGGIDANTFPAVAQLRAINLPPRTDRYAPPCLVAESVAGIVQSRWRQLPRRVWARGARWNGGIWRVTYQFHKTRDGGYMKMSAQKGAQRITANLLS
jgi:hypothetical protein